MYAAPASTVGGVLLSSQDTVDCQSPSAVEILFSLHSCAYKKWVTWAKPGWLVIPLARLDIPVVSVCIKIESSSFSHSWDMDGAPKISNVSRDVTTPFSGTVYCPSAGTSYRQPVHQMWSLFVYSLGRYERHEKCYRKHSHSIEHIRLPIRL